MKSGIFNYKKSDLIINNKTTSVKSPLKIKELFDSIKNMNFEDIIEAKIEIESILKNGNINGK